VIRDWRWFSLVFSISRQQVDSSRNQVDYAHSQVDYARLDVR